MLWRITVVCVALIGLTPVTVGDVKEWGGAPGGYSIDLLGNVVITAPGTYKFESRTNGVLDDINSLTVNQGVNGAVVITIADDPNTLPNDDPNGAANVGPAARVRTHAAVRPALLLVAR